MTSSAFRAPGSDVHQNNLDSDVVTSLSLAAVLWDMDGTLVDTEPYWMAAERDLVHSFGGTWTAEDGLTLVGSGLWVSAGILRSRGVALNEQQIIDDLIERVLDQTRHAVPWRPGAVELLGDLHEASIPTALVTMSTRPLADYVARSLGFPAFSVIVSGEEVEHPKPHPEPYLLAASRLGVDIADCVAIEDSVPGLASASASGAATIGVAAHVPLAESAEYTLWPTLTGATTYDLAAVLLSRRAFAGGAGSAHER